MSMSELCHKYSQMHEQFCPYLLESELNATMYNGLSHEFGFIWHIQRENSLKVRASPFLCKFLHQCKVFHMVLLCTHQTIQVRLLLGRP